MRRAMALATATAAWVLLIQVASTAMAPPVIVELSPVDVSRGTDATSLIVLPDGTVTVTTTTTPQDFPSATVAPTTTTTTAAPTTTTTTTSVPVRTTTAPPPAATTTAAPAATTTAAPITTTTAAPVAGSFSAAAESEFISKINGVRSSVGLAGLAANAELNNYARWWAKQMADSGNFSHSDINSLLDPWVFVAENIGSGSTVASIFNALVNSPAHYNNMVDTRGTSVGVGAYVDAAGRIWTAHVFGG